MEVLFEDAGLQKIAEDESRLKKKYGPQQTKVIQARLAVLRAASNVEELKQLPGRWHSLSSNWAGHWSGDLKHPERLIISATPPPPLNEDGGVDWAKVTSVTVVGIENTH